MQLQELLFSQGFGTRRVCAGLIQHGHVTVDGQAVTDAACDIEAQEGLRYTVQGKNWEYHAKAYVLLNKPAGTECSQKPSTWPSVYTLLPDPLRQRPVKGGVDGVQAVGRLDQDTTGLLLLSDDGKFLHRMASPRHHVPKVYEAEVKHPLDEAQLGRLREGVVLDDDPRPVRALAADRLDERRLQLTLDEGKYHQVKRMVAAAGNRVEALCRTRIGDLQLPVGLAPGQWRWLTAAEIESLFLVKKVAPKSSSAGG
ncbi:16S rRNA pseudouridine(516) synthase [uncultured Pseudacidovorax sp.]|uniref:pseudouridine synthase n=1 Tax=uncultured Pseudacidovorax sp. TaxID=679313 RepID=UPI0025E1484F|nr:16S rRNA pseudouridine(516) synthase [uncultured Pseudacidovorax sp.]